MAVPAKVTWAKMSDYSEATLVKLGGVTKRLFGWSSWQLEPHDAIAMIEQDEWRFFIEIDGQKLWLEIDEADDGEKRLGLSGKVDPGTVFASLPDTPNQ